MYRVEAPLAGFRWHGDQESVRNLKGCIEEMVATPVCYGGRAPARLESCVRVRMVSRVPGPLKELVLRAGLCAPYRNCLIRGLEKGMGLDRELNDASTRTVGERGERCR